MQSPVCLQLAHATADGGEISGSVFLSVLRLAGSANSFAEMAIGRWKEYEMRSQYVCSRVKGLLVSCCAVLIFAFSMSRVAAQTPSAPTNPRIVELNILPEVILDNGIGHWVVDRFAGNTKAGALFYQGPAREVGGLHRPQRAVEADDGVYLAVVEEEADHPTRLLRVADGMLRLVMEKEGQLEGPIELCQAGYPIWNAHERTLYLTGPYCIRKVVDDGDGTRSVVRIAGTCGTAGATDGPALSATLQRPRGWAAGQNGAIYWLEDNALRKFANGSVSTVPLTRPESTGWLWNFGPGYYLLSAGENENTLYVSGYYDTQYGYGILRVNLLDNTVRKVIGVDKDNENHGKETDGPATINAGFIGGARGIYHPGYRAVFLDGADTARFRWWRLDNDGWVRTALGTPRPETPAQSINITLLNSVGVLGETFRTSRDTWRIQGFAGVGEDGAVYLVGKGSGTDRSGFWRAYAPELMP